MIRSNRKSTLDTLVAKKVITPESLACVIECLDPFHDTNITPTGLPDEEYGPSVIQVVKKTLSITAPAGLAANQLWDCHIFNLPERQTTAAAGFSNSIFVNLDQYGNMTSNAANWPANPTMYPINVVSVGAGGDTLPIVGNTQPPIYVTTGIDFNDYFAGNSRVIALAWEEHNVTNKLNVQGTCTAYKMPQNLCSQYIPAATLSGATFSSDSITSRLPPPNAAAAMLLPNSKQWEAEFGAYCVCTADLEHNPAITSELGIRTFLTGDWDGGLNGASSLKTGWVAIGNPSVGTLSGTYYFKPTPFSTSGQFFTGLSQSTVLTLTAHAIIETFPTQASPLVTLARPAPDYDPMFFTVHKAIIQDLPPAVMVGENADGRWWDVVLDVVDAVAPAIPVAGPILKLASSGARAVTSAVRQSKADVQNLKKRTTVDNQFKNDGGRQNPNTLQTSRKKESAPALRPKKKMANNPANAANANWKTIAKGKK